MARTTAIILLLLVSFKSFGQTDDVRFNEFSFRFSNDFSHFSDRYYSNGFFGELTTPGLSKNPLRYILLTPRKANLIYNSVTVTHDFFTPDFHKDYESSRPFASYLLVGSKQLVILPEKKLRITSELQMGLIGTDSGGEKIQNGTHHIFPGADTVSWENQVKNDLGLNYRVLFEKQAFRSDYAEVVMHGEAQIGTPFTQASLGVRLQLGLFENNFAAKQKVMRPWQMYLYNDVTGSAVIHNSTIQGGVFRDNPYIREDLNHLLINIETGVGFAYKNIILEFGQHLLTPEFALGSMHKWGYFNLKVRF